MYMNYDDDIYKQKYLKYKKKYLDLKYEQEGGRNEEVFFSKGKGRELKVEYDAVDELLNNIKDILRLKHKLLTKKSKVEIAEEKISGLQKAVKEADEAEVKTIADLQAKLVAAGKAVDEKKKIADLRTKLAEDKEKKDAATDIGFKRRYGRLANAW